MARSLLGSACGQDCDGWLPWGPVAGGERFLFGQYELSGGCDLETIFFLPVQDHDHALAPQKLLARDHPDVTRLRSAVGRGGWSLLQGIVHSPPLNPNGSRCQ